MSGVQRAILIVDDEPGIQAVCCTVLRRAGFTVVPSGNGVQAMNLCRERNGEIDLLVTDVHLGCEPNGLELADTIRAMSNNVEVLVMSGTPGMDELATAKGYAFMAKPFAPAVLLQTIQELLDGSSAAPSDTAGRPHQSVTRRMQNRSRRA